MLHLYLDNFRGFSKTVIPLSLVNFLVGENSTGKSSVLALMNLLSSPYFWFSQNFNLPEHEFGGFRDILSATAPRGAEFSFGVYDALDGRDETANSFCFVASYNERDALPSVAFFARLHGTHLLAIRKKRKLWKYVEKEIPTNLWSDDPSKVFALLHAERSADEKGYKNMPEEIPSQAEFLPMLALLGNLALHGKPVPSEPAFPAIPLRLSRDFAWLAPIRTKPKRTYDGYGASFSPEGEHTPYLLRRMLSPSSKAESFRSALEKFGKASGLFSTVKIHRLGEDATAPFELLVYLLPLCPLRINSVGYGVSQVLPLVAEMLARAKQSWFAIQQPEVHLHPRAQAALGDLIFQMAETEHKHFFIETHSDFTIDRFRMNFKRTPEHRCKAQVLFFERSGEGNTVHVLPLKDNGEYPEEQPQAFRDFFLKEQMALLGL